MRFYSRKTLNYASSGLVSNYVSNTAVPKLLSKLMKLVDTAKIAWSNPQQAK